MATVKLLIQSDHQIWSKRHLFSVLEQIGPRFKKCCLSTSAKIKVDCNGCYNLRIRRRIRAPLSKDHGEKSPTQEQAQQPYLDHVYSHGPDEDRCTRLKRVARIKLPNPFQNRRPPSTVPGQQRSTSPPSSSTWHAVFFGAATYD